MSRASPTRKRKGPAGEAGPTKTSAEGEDACKGNNGSATAQAEAQEQFTGRT
jgi:hypothetical protein